MMRTTTTRMASLAVAAFVAVSVFAAPAFATTILVVDNTKLWTDTSAGKQAQAKLQDFQKKLEAIVGEPMKDIVAEAQDLKKKQEDKKLGEKEFVTQARVLQAKEMQIRQQAEAALRQAGMSARAQFFEAIRPALLELLKEKKADILMDKSQIMFSMDGVEATKSAIIKIEAKLPKFDVKLPELKADGEAEGPAPKKGKKSSKKK